MSTWSTLPTDEDCLSVAALMVEKLSLHKTSSLPPVFSTEDEHPVSAKFRGLRNRFVRLWVLGTPHEQSIFTSVFENNLIFPGANRISAAFQLRFSSVEEGGVWKENWSQNIRVPQNQTFGQIYLFVFQLAKTGCSPSVFQPTPLCKQSRQLDSRELVLNFENH